MAAARGALASPAHRTTTDWLRCECASVDLTISGYVVSGTVQRIDDALQRDLIRVEGNAESVLLHVGRNGLNVTELFDGPPGLRGCTASDDSRCFQDVSDAFREGASRNTDGDYERYRNSSHGGLS